MKITPKELVTIAEKLGIPDDIDAYVIYWGLDMICKLSGCFASWYCIKAEDILDEIAKGYIWYEKTGSNINYKYRNKEETFTYVSLK